MRLEVVQKLVEFLKNYEKSCIGYRGCNDYEESKMKELVEKIMRVDDETNLRILADVIRNRMTQLDQLKVMKLKNGMKVSFDGKFGRVKGVIDGLSGRLRKTVPIKADNGVKWRVSVGLLTIEDGKILEESKDSS